MFISCHEDLLGSMPLSKKFLLAKEVGFDGIDLRGDLLTRRVDEVKKFCNVTEISVPSVYSRLTVPLLSKTNEERNIAMNILHRRLLDSSAIGATNLVVVPIFGLPRISFPAQNVELKKLEISILMILLNELGPLAEKLHVNLVLEPLNTVETHFLTSPAEVAEICRSMGQPYVKTMIDSYHVDVNGQDAVWEIQQAFDEMVLVHLSSQDRGLPTSDGTVHTIVSAMEKKGYKGYYGFECNGVYNSQQLKESIQEIRSIT